MATLADIEKLKVADLKKELKNRGLSSTGNKQELLERLQLALTNSSLESTTDVSVTEEDVTEDDVLGDDEILAVDPKAGNSLLSDDGILSPVHTTTKPTMKVTAIEKENATVTSTTTTTPKTVVATKPKVNDAKVFCETATSVKVLSAEDKMLLRAKRFNAMGTEETRKLARAERFGIETTTATGNRSITNGGGGAVPPNLEKLQQRANRFGACVSKSLQQLDEKNRLQKRKERFGAIVVSSASKGIENDINDQKKKRAERFKITI